MCAPFRFPLSVCMTASSSKCSPHRKQIWHVVIFLLVLLLLLSFSVFFPLDRKIMELMLLCYLSLHSSQGQESKQQKVGWREWGDGGGQGASGDMQAVEEGDSGRRDSVNRYSCSAGMWNGTQGQFKERHIRLPIVPRTNLRGGASQRCSANQSLCIFSVSVCVVCCCMFRVWRHTCQKQMKIQLKVSALGLSFNQPFS